MARRRASTTPDRVAEAEAERRARLQRERERRRLEAQRSRPAAAPAARRARPAGASATATRERHEGLVGWVARTLMSIPSAIVGVLRGFALEVVAVVASSLRFVVGLVPGGRRIATVQRSVRERARSIELPTLGGHELPDDVMAPRVRRQRTAAEQRVHEQRRALLRRRLRLVLLLALVVSAVLAWVYVPASDAFRIRHVGVTGASAVGDLEARMRVDELLRGETVFTVDEEAVAKRLEELPFVRSASVERHLPGGLELRIEEYRPLALGYGDGHFWLVARDGRILARASKKEWSGRVPIVTLRGDALRPGVRVGDEPALRLLAARAAGSTLRLEQVVVEEFSIVGTIADGVEVRFGRAELLAQKVAVAELLLREARRKGLELVYVDVSVPSRPALCAREDAGCLLPRGRQDEEETASGEGEQGAEAAGEAAAGVDTEGADEAAADDDAA